jgi:hypothetical protein
VKTAAFTDTPRKISRDWSRYLHRRSLSDVPSAGRIGLFPYLPSASDNSELLSRFVPGLKMWSENLELTHFITWEVFNHLSFSGLGHALPNPWEAHRGLGLHHRRSVCAPTADRGRRDFEIVDCRSIWKCPISYATSRTPRRLNLTARDAAS